MELGLLDLVVVLVVGAVVAAISLLNRRRAEKEKIKVSTELVAALVVALGLLVLLASRWDAVHNDPLVVGALVGTFASVAIGVSILGAVSRVRRDLSQVASQVGAQMAGIGNLQFYATKAETLDALVEETISAKEKLIATRFSPADISTEDAYWRAIRQKAMDPKVLYVRIHCLAHASSTAIDGVCRLIYELRGAEQFRLAITFANNSFEMILADEKECMFCFHDLEMTIRNGFRVDRNLPSSAQVVDNFGSTLRRMIEDSYLVIDFGRWVRSVEDVERLQEHLRRIHSEFRMGRLPEVVHSARREDFLLELFARV